MKHGNFKRSASCFLLWCILFLPLYTTACAANTLPSQEEAERIKDGMTYYEAVDILGSRGEETRTFSTGALHVQWKLDNGKALIAAISNEGMEELPRLGNPRLIDTPWTVSGGDYLTQLKAFDNIEDYNAYASQENLATYSQNFIYASALKCLGEFSLYYYEPIYWQNEYEYHLTDVNSVTLRFEISENQSSVYTDQERPVRDALPENMVDMTQTDPTVGAFYYNRNGLQYCYSKTGMLANIQWVDNNIRFQLDWSPHNYPMDGEDTIVKRLLSLDDAVAMDAWDELKTYIRENNKKPIDWKPIMLGTGAAVVVVGVGATVWVIVHKKRKRAAAEQSSAVPEPITEE